MGAASACRTCRTCRRGLGSTAPFQAAGLAPPAPSIVTLSVQLTTTLVATGKFVGILPSSVAQFSAKRVGLKVLPVKVPGLRASVSISPSSAVLPVRWPSYSFAQLARSQNQYRHRRCGEKQLLASDAKVRAQLVRRPVRSEE